MTDDGSMHDGGGDEELAFEHIGTMRCGDELLVCDVDYFPARFAGMARGGVSLGLSVAVEPGTWQVLLARGPDGQPAVILLTHDRELDVEDPLEHTQVIGRVQLDSGRVTAIDPELRDDEDMQTAVIEAPREQVPCMLRPFGDREDAPPRGVLLDVDFGGVAELHGHGSPATVLLLAMG